MSQQRSLQSPCLLAGFGAAGAVELQPAGQEADPGESELWQAAGHLLGGRLPCQAVRRQQGPGPGKQAAEHQADHTLTSPPPQTPKQVGEGSFSLKAAGASTVLSALQRENTALKGLVFASLSQAQAALAGLEQVQEQQSSGDSSLLKVWPLLSWPWSEHVQLTA